MQRAPERVRAPLEPERDEKISACILNRKEKVSCLSGKIESWIPRSIRGGRALLRRTRDHVVAGEIKWPEGGVRTTEMIRERAWGEPVEPKPSLACERSGKRQLRGRQQLRSEPSRKSGKPHCSATRAATTETRARRKGSTRRNEPLVPWSIREAWRCTELPTTSASPFFCR
jgi:hypothetical protein